MMKTMMKIKKPIFVIGVCVLLISSALPVFAAESSAEYPSDMDVGHLKSEIASFINGTSFAEELSIKARSSDVDFSKAVKVFVDTNIMDFKTNNFNEIKMLLEKESDAIFEVPVCVDGHYFMANIQREIPLTGEKRKLLDEAQLKEYDSKAGKWIVSSAGQFESKKEYETYYEGMTAGYTDKEHLLVGGLPYFHLAVAIFPDSEGEIGELVPTAPDAVPWETFGLSYDKKTELPKLDYKKIKSIINKLPKEFADEASGEIYASGASGSYEPGQTPSNAGATITPIIFVAGAAIAVSLFVIFIVKKRKRNIN
ncbi:MAG: hypothetical protein LBG82_08590 [Clostridiales Family XIII bacterium]|jgi:hypothetical protein|nr:hypothetical protein [Clostridiales Family XIII bacterium]